MSKIKNEHLIPDLVKRLVEEFENEKRDDVKLNYLARLDAIGEYIDNAIANYHNERTKKFN